MAPVQIIENESSIFAFGLHTLKARDTINCYVTNGASVDFLSFSLLRIHENMQRTKLLEGLRWECIVYIRLRFIV